MVNLRSATLTNISALPTELIIRVLEAILEDDEFVSASGLYGLQNRYTFLAQTASLLCRQFSEPARMLLWKRLYLVREEQALLLLASSAFGKYGGNWLSVGGRFCTGSDQALTGRTMEKIVRGLEGLDHLEIWGFDETDNVDISLLYGSNLQGLQTLELDALHLLSDVFQLSPCPFHLTTLHVDGYTTSCPSLLSLFSSESLRHLHLNLYGTLTAPQIEDVSLLLYAVAPTLRTLTIEEPLGVLPNLSRFASALRELEELTVRCTNFEQILQLFRHIPSHLSYLTLDSDDFGGDEKCVPSLLRIFECSSVSKLKTLYLRVDTATTIQLIAFLHVVESKDILLVYT